MISKPILTSTSTAISFSINEFDLPIVGQHSVFEFEVEVEIEI